MQLTRLSNVKPCRAECVLISSIKRAVDVATGLTQAVCFTARTRGELQLPALENTALATGRTIVKIWI